LSPHWSAEQQRAAQGKATKLLEEAEDLVCCHLVHNSLEWRLTLYRRNV
jgi:hypothetical protein